MVHFENRHKENAIKKRKGKRRMKKTIIRTLFGLIILCLLALVCLAATGKDPAVPAMTSSDITIGLFTIIVTLILFILGGIYKAIHSIKDDFFFTFDNHKHELECNNSDCDIKVGKPIVVIPEHQKG